MWNCWRSRIDFGIPSLNFEGKIFLSEEIRVTSSESGKSKNLSVMYQGKEIR